jgi:hypothetical protein
MQSFKVLNKYKIKKIYRKRENITIKNGKLAMQREGVFHGYRVPSEKYKGDGMPTCNILQTLGQRIRIYSSTNRKSLCLRQYVYKDQVVPTVVWHFILLLKTV